MSFIETNNNKEYRILMKIIVKPLLQLQSSQIVLH